MTKKEFLEEWIVIKAVGLPLMEQRKEIDDKIQEIVRRKFTVQHEFLGCTHCRYAASNYLGIDRCCKHEHVDHEGQQISNPNAALYDTSPSCHQFVEGIPTPFDLLEVILRGPQTEEDKQDPPDTIH